MASETMASETMAIKTVADIIRRYGTSRRDAPAIDFEGRTITYGELDARSSQVANALAAEGVGVQDRVAIIDKNAPQFFEVMFGLSKLNAVDVAVNWRLAPAEMAQVVSDAQAKVLFVGAEFVPQVEKFERELSPGPRIIAIDEHDRWADFEGWVSGHSREDPGVEAAGDDTVLQLYTSGTTGKPKGAMITHDNFFNGAMDVTDSWRFDSGSVSLALMPLYHIGGTGWSMVGLYHGCRIVLLRAVEPAQIVEVMPKYGVTNAFFVPAVIQMLLATPGVEEADFSALRAIAYGASPITDKVLLRSMEVFGCELIQMYGMTETTGAICQLDGADHDPVNRPHLLRSCGKPYPWVELRIVDPETGVDVAQGEVGELWTRSTQNMKGYWNDPVATAAAITEDGWLRTGDAGYRDAEGYLYLHDRVKDMIVSGGENVYPAEIENVLMKHPDVADVAVVGVPDERWGEAVKAVVVRAPGGTVTEGELIAFAREHLGGYKLPKSVDFTDELPRNPTGKLLKREIRSPYWKGHGRGIG